MTTRRKKKSQDGFLKKVSSLFNLDTVSHSLLNRTFTSLLTVTFRDLGRNADRDLSPPKISLWPARAIYRRNRWRKEICTRDRLHSSLFEYIGTIIFWATVLIDLLARENRRSDEITQIYSLAENSVNTQTGNLSGHLTVHTKCVLQLLAALYARHDKNGNSNVSAIIFLNTVHCTVSSSFFIVHSLDRSGFLNTAALYLPLTSFGVEGSFESIRASRSYVIDV